MSVINKNTAKVALVDFAKADKGNFWRKKLINLYYKWEALGNIKEYQVVYYEIPWSEKAFLQMDLEKQRHILIKILIW